MLSEAYEQPINDCDIGIIYRSILFSKLVSVFLFLNFDRNEKYLDYAGGYGVFVRLMRDIGFNFVWEDKYTTNIFAKGFEWDRKTKVKAITCFEVFEHLPNPREEISKLLGLCDTLIFSTELLPNDVPLPEDWDYYGLEHGQHISFFSKSTLEHIARVEKLHFYSLGSVHIFSKRRIHFLKLLLCRFAKFGLNRFVAKRMNSLLNKDYLFMKDIT